MSSLLIVSTFGFVLNCQCLASYAPPQKECMAVKSISGIIDFTTYNFNIETGYLIVKAVSGIPSTFINKIKEKYPTINRDLKSLDIQKTYGSIGPFAFCNCPNLVSVNIAPGVTTIGESAFENCTALSVVYLPNGMEGFHKRAFFNTGLTMLLLPTTASMISTQSFPESTQLIWADSEKNIHLFRLKDNTLAWFLDYNEHKVMGSGLLDYYVINGENAN